MSECKCSMAIKVFGDGCEVCNPAQALWYAKGTIEDQANEIEWLRGTLAIVRQHPDFDEGGPMAEMIDEALTGEKPELLKNLERIQSSVKPNTN